MVQGIARPRDLVGIRQSLEALPQIQDVAGADREREAGFLDSLAALDPCQDVVDAHRRGHRRRSARDAEQPAASSARVSRPSWTTCIAASRDAKAWIANLEKQERERTGIKNLKVGYNKVFGYYLEVTKANVDAVPEDYIRKQTLVNAERYITPELKEYEALILNAEERMAELETRLFREVCEQVAARGRAPAGSGPGAGPPGRVRRAGRGGRAAPLRAARR